MPVRIPNFKAPSLPSVLQRPNQGRPAAQDDKIFGPWSQNFDPSSFYKPIEIEGSRWNKLYPYRLLVVFPVQQAQGSTLKYQIFSTGTTAQPILLSPSADSFRLLFNFASSNWEFNLPITPQQLSISNMFTETLTATQRGVVQEQGGAKFKMISMNGSFGIWPNRGNVNKTSPTPPNSLQTLFGGTLQAFGNLQNNINNTISAFQGKNPNPTPTNPIETDSIGGYAGTGYAHALLLDQFLEQYSELKKRPEYSQLRLAVDLPKQNQTFLVTPMAYSYNQDSSSPNEYKFNLQLKAFRRISLTQGVSGNTLTPPNPLETNTLQNVLNSLTEARRALGSAFNLVGAVRSDVLGPFNALREATLFVKGLSGLVATVADLPGNILQDTKFVLADSLANLNQEDLQLSQAGESVRKNLGIAAAFRQKMEGQNLNNSSVQNSLQAQTDPVNKVYENPEQNFELFNLLNVDSVNFPVQARNAIDNEISRASLLTADDMKTHKNTLQELAYQISNVFGTGDATFSRVYGRPAPKTRLQEITIDEYDILKKLYDSILALGVLTATDAVNQNQNAAYEFVKAEAEAADIEFQDSSSKIRAPVPFGLTIEQIAQRYLGNQERWLEIVTLNNLRSPYIDEVGFTLPFLSNGDGRQFNVSSSQNLFIGQNIILSSSTQPKQRRKIINIERINDTNFLISVDGPDNLSIFTTTNSSTLLAYLPGTVNSQDQIFIPSDLPVPEDLITRPVPATSQDSLTGLSKIDFLMTDDNDIAIDSFGDFRLSFGLTNLLQALKIKFITEPGQLIRHVDFGSGLRQGTSTADLEASAVYNSISSLIAQDPRFSGIEKLEVIKEGPILRVNLSVFIANGLGVFPISFQLAS